jgi:hypothetical protein
VIPTDNLRHLHDRLRSGITLVSQLEDRLHERGAHAGKLEAFDRVADYLRDVVVPHLRAELRALYPEAALVAGVDTDLVRRLTANCEELERQVNRVLRDRERAHQGTCDQVSCRRHITTLVRLLRRHLHSVEDELLPHLDSELREEDVLRIYERIEEASFDAEIASRPAAGVDGAA